MTNLDNSDEVLKIYRSRIGIKAMFKDYKTGGYNLEVSQTNTQGLTNLILLIAIVYTASYDRGKLIKKSGHQNLIYLLTEVCKKDKRHSNFWGCMQLRTLGDSSRIFRLYHPKNDESKP